LRAKVARLLAFSPSNTNFFGVRSFYSACEAFIRHKRKKEQKDTKVTKETKKKRKKEQKKQK
jgi:hypothetical protein